MGEAVTEVLASELAVRVEGPTTHLAGAWVVGEPNTLVNGIIERVVIGEPILGAYGVLNLFWAEEEIDARGAQFAGVAVQVGGQ